jgi:hypothetical protein
VEAGFPKDHAPLKIHDPEKACPRLDRGIEAGFPKDHAPLKIHDPEKACPRLDRGWKPVFQNEACVTKT